jgi:hypothetical protein
VRRGMLAGAASVVGGPAGLAGGAQPPERHLGLVDLETVRGTRVEAGRLADGAVDIRDLAAASADDMVVVVAGARLVAGRTAGGLDPACQAGAGERPEHVVDRLGGHRVEASADLPGDLVDLEVAAASQDIEHGKARPGDP